MHRITARILINQLSIIAYSSVLILTIIAPSYILATPISVPLDHWSYSFFERLQAKGMLKDFLDNTKPYSRDEMVKMLIYVSNLLEAKKINLNNVEKDQLELLKKEFAPELSRLGMKGADRYRHLLDWSGDGKTLLTEIGYIQDTVVRKGTEDYEIYGGTLHVLIRGDIQNSLFFNTDNKIIFKNSDEPVPAWRPYMVRYKTGTHSWFENFSDSYLIFRFPWADLQIGKDNVLWGPGYHGVVGLSGANPTFDIVKLPIRIWKVKFSSLLGFLRDDLGKKYLSDITKKYISAHRLEISPISGLCIGWQEVFVYDQLHIEMINPIMPYAMAQDYLGETGNYTSEGDIDICLIPNTRLYLSLFLDDLHLFEKLSFFKHGANRWAGLGGILITDPFGIDNFDLRAEYARVEPWTYPHKGIIQDPPIPTSYKHFDTPLGHWIGPNADDLFFETNYRFSKDFIMTLSYDKIRKGEIGGSLYNYSEKAMFAEKRFLDGIIEKTQTISLGMKYRLFQDSTAEIKYSHTKVNNKQKEEAKLPEYTGKKLPWEAGHNWSQNVLQVTVVLNY